MASTPLTRQQIKDREKLLDGFRKAITAAIWEQIEQVDQSLLCDNDGVPYGSTWNALAQQSGLEQMVNEATKSACGTLHHWL